MGNKTEEYGTSKAQREEQKSLSEELSESANTIITIEDLYSQLQSLKHDIEIESIQKKLNQYDQFFKAIGDDEAVLIDMINWYKQNKQKAST